MRKLKIAFFSDMLVRDYDGCMRTVFHILDRQPESVEIKFFTGRGAVKGLNQPYVGVPEIKIPFNSDYNMALPSIVSEKLNQELDDFAPDVVHVTSPSRLGQFAVSYAKQVRVPVSTIYHTHFLSYMDYYFSKARFLMPLAKKFVTRQTRNFYNACSLVLVPTEEMREELTSIGVAPHKMKIWQRGLDHTIYNPQKAADKKLTKIVGNAKPNLLFASRLVWEKNLKTLVDIYKEIELGGHQYNLVIVGDGVAAAEIKRMMPRVYFLGKRPQEELAALYASADVFVFPSVSETYGNVVVEAMACGLPCVVANGGGSKSFVTNGINGYVVSPYAASAYLEKVALLLQYPAHYKAVVSAGIRYTSDLSWDRLVDRFYLELELLKMGAISHAA